MPILMDSDERPIEVDDGAATEIFRLRAENERLRECDKEYWNVVERCMTLEAEVETLTKENERLRAECEAIKNAISQARSVFDCEPAAKDVLDYVQELAKAKSRIDELIDEARNRVKDALL